MKSEELRNLILAIVLSALVLIGWNFYFGPKLQPKPQAAAGCGHDDVADGRAGRAEPGGFGGPCGRAEDP